MINLRVSLCTVAALAMIATPLEFDYAFAQEVASTNSTDTSSIVTLPPAALSEDDLNKLVARIALYPDDLIAVITSASLFPIQIIEAQRFLDESKTNKDLKPKDDWDGSVISLLNYPPIVKMMSDDLDWTQDLATALTYQEDDVLNAIQQLRDVAVADKVLKTDDKMTVTTEDDNVVIASTSDEVTYIPEYPPEMLYEDDYAVVPIDYYGGGSSYPSYWWPGAGYWAGFWTGAIWGGIVDWNGNGIWSGRWNGAINCNNCFNGINGKINAGDFDFRNVDRSKVSFDRDQFKGGNRDQIRNGLKNNQANNLKDRAKTVNRDRQANSARAGKIKDARASAQGKVGDRGKGNFDRNGGGFDKGKINAGNGNRMGNAGNGNRIGNASPQAKAAAAGKARQAAGKPKAGARVDNRTRNPSALGEVRGGGKVTKSQAAKGKKAMQSRSGGKQSVNRGGGGGGNRSVNRGGGGGGNRSVNRGGGGGRSYGGGGGRGGGGGGRGGGGGGRGGGGRR